MTPPRPVVAFHAPLKSPEAETPSGDRRIARLTLAALERAGFAPRLASRRRTLDLAGDPARQACEIAAAEAEAAALAAAEPPDLWFTYHCYWKAPDLLGPRVARALSIPYVISEPSRSPRRREGPWALYAAEAEAALAAADLLLWSTPRDLPMLEAADPPLPLAPLPPFLDLGPPPTDPPPANGPLHLAAAAMMRPGDKRASYAALAEALRLATDRGLDWRLSVAGDGGERGAIERLFAPFGARATLLGQLEEPALRALFEAADLLVWPGVGEGFGMVYLEAQAAGLPCLAEDRPGPRHVIDPARALPPPENPSAFADALISAAADRPALRAARASARAHVERHHGLDAAAARLAALLTPLIEARR